MPVKPTCEPNKVRLTGPGVSSKGVPASLPTEFTVDARDAGFGDLEAQILVRVGRSGAHRVHSQCVKDAGATCAVG